MERDARPRGAAYASMMTLGLQLAIAVVAFFFLGRWLDGKLGTSPWLMLAGLAVGAGGGLLSFVRKAVELGREQDRLADERRKGASREPQE
jgi:F0F1-type ATP synthase assembly protein I